MYVLPTTNELAFSPQSEYRNLISHHNAFFSLMQIPTKQVYG